MSWNVLNMQYGKIIIYIPACNPNNEVPSRRNFKFAGSSNIMHENVYSVLADADLFILCHY
jgi:hypothetical protein